MKKLTIILLALAVAAFAVPAFAGDVSVSGTYEFDGESYTGQGDLKRAWYDDELRVNISVTQGDVKAFVGLEVSDDAYFDGSNNERSSEKSPVYNTAGTETGDYVNDIVNDYYVEWSARDDLKVKIGEYGLSFGRMVVIYADPAAHEIGLTYSGLENVTLGLYLGKMVEAYNDDDDDTDTISLLANVKGVEFFKKLDFLYISGDAKNPDVSFGYMGFDTAFKAGPVDVALEYGNISDDVGTNEASFTYAELGFDELAGFDINLVIFDSSEDGNLEGRFGGNFFFPLQIVGFDGDITTKGMTGSLSALRLIMVTGSYKINDKMTVIGKVLASGTEKVSDDSVGTEIDAHLKYQFSDNVSGTLTYASWSPGDAYYGGDGDNETVMRARLNLKF